MKYIAYKLNFQTGVHFGQGMLNETKECFLADTLYSALCIEAIKGNCLDRFYQMTKSGRILFSDGFPFVSDTLYIPKPMIRMEHEDNVSDRKKWKKLAYIPIHRLESYLTGKLDVEKESILLKGLGNKQVYQKVKVNDSEKTEPYTVGVYHFHEGNGIYFIMGYEDDDDKMFVEDLIDSLGYQGIGGKVSSGLGKFTMLPMELPEEITKHFNKGNGKFVLLTSALPLESEMQEVIHDANYLLEKRGGFIQSGNYADELVKKQDLYFLKSGSVVSKKFKGDIYNVDTKGSHPVWKYAKPILMEVSI